jgi:hypothetical protein
VNKHDDEFEKDAGDPREKRFFATVGVIVLVVLVSYIAGAWLPSLFP